MNSTATKKRDLGLPNIECIIRLVDWPAYNILTQTST